MRKVVYMWLECPKCGATNIDIFSHFCPFCGTSLKGVEPKAKEVMKIKEVLIKKAENGYIVEVWEDEEEKVYIFEDLDSAEEFIESYLSD